MNRYEIFDWVKKQYGTEPEYLWAKYPNYAVLRNENNKWYAVIMDVPKQKLGIKEVGIVDILDVKCDPVLIGTLRMQSGFYPAYHMNKDHWISISLDSMVSDDEMKNLIDMSYAMTVGKRKR